MKRTIGLITIVGWPTLGFTRGMNSYDYNYSKNQLYKHNHDKNVVVNPIYLDKLMWGTGGIFVYLNPFTFFFMLYKEVYRLEVNLRGLEEDKKKDFYNEVL